VFSDLLVTQNRTLNSPKSVTEIDLWLQPQGASKFFTCSKTMLRFTRESNGTKTNPNSIIKREINQGSTTLEVKSAKRSTTLERGRTQELLKCNS
jgi:hypothetical protein